MFDSGEWDDALIVKTDTVEQFRIKHDSENLYFAVLAGGGDLVFDMDAGVRVLHWSAQLGSAEYVKSGTSVQVLDKPFAYELWGLQDEPFAVIQETLAEYLSKNGWTSNTASMGNLMQSELAISFEWLGLDTKSGRFVELPKFRIGAGLMLTRDDPRAKELFSLPREELNKLYPFVRWPSKSIPKDSIGGSLPDTIRVDGTDFGRIWIDLEK
ncbi:hypothetical protein ACFLQT_00430 [Bacteroidota bacterium]